jgi:hypothetical protein
MRIFRCIVFTAIFAFHLIPARGAGIDVVFNDNRFGELNDVTGDYRQIGTLPISVSSGIASMNGLLYLEDAGNNLYTVDPVSGASRLIGPTGVSDPAGAFAGGSKGLFEVDYASNLYRIEPGSGKAKLVGATGLAANNGALDSSLSFSSSDSGSLFYTAGKPGASDELFQINITTGVAMDLGGTGVTGIAGSAYVNGALELYQYGQPSNYIYSALAGSTTFQRGASLGVQPIDGGTVSGALSSSESGGQDSESHQTSAATPEPATFLLVGSGLLLVGCIGGRKRRHVPS